MFERFTDDARKVIFFARYEASRLGSSALETDHLWLGLLRQSKKLIKRIAPQVTQTLIESRLTPVSSTAPRISMTVDLPLSEGTQRVIAAAVALADAQGQLYVTPERLILSLLDEDANSSAQG